MKKRKKRNGDPVAKAAAGMSRAKSEKPDVLGELSRWLNSQWLRSYVMASALGSETDREQMLRLGKFIDALKEVRK